MAVVPIWRLSGNAGLGQRGIFRPFVCVGVRRYGWEMPGYRSEAIPDHFVARRHVGMVGICQAVTAWHFATKCLVQVDWKWSEIARLQRRGISRPFFSGMAYKNGRDLPGCRTEANHDRFWVRWHRLCRLRGARRLQTSGACGGARRLRDARRLRGPSGACRAPDRAFGDATPRGRIPRSRRGGVRNSSHARSRPPCRRFR